MNQPNKEKLLSGWGNYPRLKCRVYRPEKQTDVISILNKNSSVIARGQGRSYGDASLNKDCVILSERLDKFIDFDASLGIITVQAGVVLAEILEVIIPKGWILPVIPGTKYVSAGGAFASNVHGKNHAKVGDFANHVTQIHLLLASGEALICSAMIHPDIFWATAGGMGLTGIIKQLSIQLMPITSLSLLTETKKTKNILEMVECFQNASEHSEYMIGWIDHFATHDALGRGVFQKAIHKTETVRTDALLHYKRKSKGITIPTFFPSCLLNKYSMALYNIKRFFSYSTDWKKEIINFDGFFHPLDHLQHWNRLYGKNGFFQYQCVLPETNDVAENLKELLAFIQMRGHFSFLAVLKYHREHKGLLSFPIRGYSLALDFPNTHDSRILEQELNAKVANMGGRVYLGKDALMTPALFEKMYHKELPQWRQIVQRLDPGGKWTSAMSDRLNMKGNPHA